MAFNSPKDGLGFEETIVSVGSGTAIYGEIGIQAGSGNVGTGSKAWIVYPKTFTVIPSVIVSANNVAEDGVVTVGSVSIGSFFTISATASEAFNWIAVGI